MSACGTHPCGAPARGSGVVSHCCAALGSNPRNPEGSLDFESGTGLFQHIPARLKIHYMLLYWKHIPVFFVSPNRSLLHPIAKLKALKKALNLIPSLGQNESVCGMFLVLISQVRN